MRPLITRDPVSGGELIATRLECPASGVVIEGRFALGWPARLTAEQLAYVRALVQHRGNVRQVAATFGVAYNTARARVDAIAAALEEPPPAPPRLETLERLARGEIAFAEALRRLRQG